MKFTDGYWGLREGVRLLAPQQTVDVARGSGSVEIFGAVKQLANRGETLNLPVVSLTLDSPMEGVIHARLQHWKGGVERGPAFAVNTSPGFAATVVDGDGTVCLRSGSLSVTARVRDGWGFDFFHDGERLTGSGPKNAGYVVDADGKRYMREQLSLGVGELVYGLGERFTPFVKNGQAVDTWNEDGGTASEQAYKNIPFFLSSRGYGVLVAHPERVSFEIGSEVVSRTQFSVPGERLDYYVIDGPTPRDVLRRYTALTGRPALPPAWSFGLWLTTSFVTTYDEKTVTTFIDGMAERRIPLHVFHFDCFWMKELQWCDFEWDRRQFPDPEGMLGRLKAQGLHICVWVNPYIAQKSPLFDEGKEQGYLVKSPDGGVWQWDRWQAGMALVDFTNPAATAWYKDKLRRLVKIGVDCFKSDFGERIPTDVVYHDGSDPAKMHNYYTYLYNEAVFGALEEERGRGDALVFARSATVGGQKFPVHWGGDCSATYESMAESLRGGLSLGLSGFGFWSHDISGFEKTATPDLYKRWAAFGLLSSHSRLHGNESYRVPWLFGEDSSDVLRRFVMLKCTLMPYLYARAVEAAESGVPLMRAMLLEFPEDPTCGFLDRQYMLGDSLLVAPIFSEDGSVTYYLPEGRWTSFLSGAVVEGGRWVTETHDYTSLPLMVKPGSIVPVGASETLTDYDYADGITLHVFELDEGAEASTVVVDPRGRAEISVSARRENGIVTVEAAGAGKPWSVLLRNARGVADAEGGTVAADPRGTLIRAAAGSQAITARLAR